MNLPRLAIGVPAIALILLSSQAWADAETPEAAALAGRVRGEGSPLKAVRVYAYQLTDLSVRKVLTDAQGQFSFASLPAGFYKIIAHKTGFVPAVHVLARATAQVHHYLDFELSQDQAGSALGREDFWSVRARIPSTVLRDMRLVEAASTDPAPSSHDFRTEMAALSGIERIGHLGEAWITGGRLGVRGRVGQTQVGLNGSFRELGSTSLSHSPAMASGKTSNISISLERSDDARLSFTSLRNTMLLPAESDLTRPAAAPIDLEHYRVSWSTPVGNKAHSDFAAHYTRENNFYASHGGSLEPLGLPDASRTLRLEGSYRAQVSENKSFRTGLSYWERIEQTGIDVLAVNPRALPRHRIDFFGVGDWQAPSELALEYGLFSTLRDGSLSVSPHGGLVLKLGPEWEAYASLRQRLSEGDLQEVIDVIPVTYRDGKDCGVAEEHCYKLQFTRRQNEDEALSIGAIHREFSDTLRLRFSEDFFDHLESLYLVQGDRLPELRFALTRRLSPRILAHLESSIASGGGGTFFASDESRYRNTVSYLVTSLDTKFQRTSTGVLLAFVRAQQELTPLDEHHPSPRPQLEMDRLQILLTQSLDLLLDLSSNWAILLDMQLSRGSTPFDFSTGADDIRKRILGGIAVKF